MTDTVMSTFSNNDTAASSSACGKTRNNVRRLPSLKLKSFGSSLLFYNLGDFVIADYEYHETSIETVEATYPYDWLQNVSISKGSLLGEANDNDQECQICSDLIEDEEVMLSHSGKCQLQVHADCGLTWFERQSTCPHCRAELKMASWYNSTIAGRMRISAMYLHREDDDEEDDADETTVGARDTADDAVVGAPAIFV